MKTNQKYKSFLMLFIILSLAFLYPANVSAEEQEQEKVKVEAVGFFTHFPMRETRNVIEEVCASFGDKVELKLYDEDKSEGQKFLKSKGLSGHIPMRLYINGVNTVIIDGKEVSFSDFVDYDWTAEELEKAITLALEGKIEAVTDDQQNGNNLPIIIFSILIGGGIIAVIIFKTSKKTDTNTKKKSEKE